MQKGERTWRRSEVDGLAEREVRPGAGSVECTHVEEQLAPRRQLVDAGARRARVESPERLPCAAREIAHLEHIAAHRTVAVVGRRAPLELDAAPSAELCAKRSCRRVRHVKRHHPLWPLAEQRLRSARCVARDAPELVLHAGLEEAGGHTQLAARRGGGADVLPETRELGARLHQMLSGRVVALGGSARPADGDQVVGCRELCREWAARRGRREARLVEAHGPRGAHGTRALVVERLHAELVLSAGLEVREGHSRDVVRELILQLILQLPLPLAHR